MVSTHFFNARGPRFESGRFWFYFLVYFCPKFLLRQEFRQPFLDSPWPKILPWIFKSRLQKLICEWDFRSLWKLWPRDLWITPRSNWTRQKIEVNPTLSTLCSARECVSSGNIRFLGFSLNLFSKEIHKVLHGILNTKLFKPNVGHCVFKDI